MTLEQKIKNRISGLEQWHSSIINQPMAMIRANGIVALEQIRARAALKELYLLLEQEPPDYPMNHARRTEP
jgi:hypothetical protein